MTACVPRLLEKYISVPSIDQSNQSAYRYSRLWYERGSPVIAVSQRSVNRRNSARWPPPPEWISGLLKTVRDCVPGGTMVMMDTTKIPNLAAQQVIDKDGWLAHRAIPRYRTYRGTTGYHRGGLRNISQEPHFGKYVQSTGCRGLNFQNPGFLKIWSYWVKTKYAAALSCPILHTWGPGAVSTKHTHTTNEEMIKARCGKNGWKKSGITTTSFGDYEQIKRYQFVTDEWSPQAVSSTPTLKKRNVIEKFYADKIEKLFEPGIQLQNF